MGRDGGEERSKTWFWLLALSVPGVFSDICGKEKL